MKPLCFSLLSFSAAIALASIPFGAQNGVATTILAPSSTSENDGSFIHAAEPGTSSASSCIRSTVTVTVTLSTQHPTYPNTSTTTCSQHVTTSTSLVPVISGQKPHNPQSSSLSSLSLLSQEPQKSASYYTDACPTTPTNMPSMTPFFGLNVVNSRPQPIGQPPYFKQPNDWDRAFDTIKKNLPKVNAVRIYSTTDDNTTEINGIAPHLKNALPAAAKYDISILAGVWSAGIGGQTRFQKEITALEDAVKTHGCKNIAAVSVGNEDLNDINKSYGWMSDADKAAKKSETVDILVSQISQVRQVLRGNSCCNIPVTHADTWNELFNTESPWVGKLLASCDHAVVANIFPYWGNASITESFNMLQYQVNLTNSAAKLHGKEMWLGETGWPSFDNGNHNVHGTNQRAAQQYFDQIGCQILSGNGTAFYYVDWDEDEKASTSTVPAFGIFDYDENPLLDLECANFKPDTRLFADGPSWFGGHS